MIKFVQSPWKDTRFQRSRNLVLSVILLFTIAISFIAVFTTYSSKAQAGNNAANCTSFRLVGDIHGAGDNKAGLKDRLDKDLGVTDYRSHTHGGRDVNDIVDEIKAAKLGQGSCLIIEGGTKNIFEKTKSPEGYTEEDNRKAIEALLEATKGAPKVFWVTPIVNESNTSGLQTKKFNKLLSEVAGQKGNNVEIIDIQQLSLDGDNFNGDSNFVMTNDGYKKRVDIIMGEIKKNVKKNDDKPSTSSSNTPAPGGDNNNGGSNNGGNTGGGNTGGGNTGGGNTGGGAPAYDRGATDGSDTNVGSSVCSSKDRNEGKCGNTDLKFAPIEKFREIQSINNFKEAQNYLMASRWSQSSLPVAPVDFEDPITLISHPMVSVANFFIGVSSLCISLLISAATAVSGDLLVTLTMRFANGTFGFLAGGSLGVNEATGTGSSARLSVIATSIATIAGIFALFNALRSDAGPIKNRLASVAWAVLKSMLSILFLVFIAFQSKKGAPGGTSGAEEMGKDNTSIIVRDGDGSTLDNNKFDRNGPVDHQRASDFQSWAPMSLGWFLSLGFWGGQQIAGAMYQIGAVFILRPIEIVTQSMSAENTGESAPACDRYADAVNLAFRKTRVAETSQNLATLMSTMDYIFYRYHFWAYKEMLGGHTFSAGNSFCTALEVQNDVNASEMLLFLRAAGMAKEFAGTGNIMDDAGTYTNGRHSAVDFRYNLSKGAPQSDGYIIRQNGTWQSASDRFNPMQRAERFLGLKHSSIGARWYFSACYWDPTQQRSYLHSTWKGVKAQGPAALIEDDMDIKWEVDLQRKEDFDKLKEAAVRDRNGLNQNIGDSGKTDKDLIVRVFDNVEWDEESGEDHKEKILSHNPKNDRLNDGDCQNSLIMPIDHLNEDASATGWGSGNPWAARWDFNPISPKSLTELLKDKGKEAVKNGFKSTVKLGWEKAKRVPVLGMAPTLAEGGYDGLKILQGKLGDLMGHFEDKPETIDINKDDKTDPSTAFFAVRSDNGSSPAETFWNTATGKGSLGIIYILCSILVGSISMLFAFTMMIPFMLVLLMNFIFSLYVLCIGAILATSIVLFAIRGGKK